MTNGLSILLAFLALLIVSTTHLASRVIKDFEEFKRISDVIVANRLTDEIKGVIDKVYTRDLFGRD
jgi:Na+-transporting methylmalonyl-CoA/oxaloacetate decarboxylase gamma subunit